MRMYFVFAWQTILCCKSKSMTFKQKSKHRTPLSNPAASPREAIVLMGI